jgi:hypothetical protein
MNEYDLIEEKWKTDKIGKVSGSSLYKIMNKTSKGLYSAERKKYMKQLAAEILTGQLTEFYKSKSMERGTEEELNAVCFYEQFTGVPIEYCGKVFFNHPTISMFGCSPDAKIPELKKGVEFKNRDCDNHLDFLLSGEVPEAAIYQCYAGMLCLGYDSWDYVSYDDRFINDNNKIKIVTIKKDQAIASQIVAEVTLFLSELDDMVKQLNARGK